jgi:hypothetical protein
LDRKKTKKTKKEEPVMFKHFSNQDNLSVEAKFPQLVANNVMDSTETRIALGLVQNTYIGFILYKPNQDPMANQILFEN